MTRLRDIPASAQAAARIQLGPNSPLSSGSGRSRPVQREAAEQRAVIAWADNPAVRALYPNLWMLMHVPNSGMAGGGRRGAYLKAQGVRSGVPDLLLPVARGPYHGLALELKAGKGRASDSQTKWMLGLAAEGWYAAVVTGSDAAIARIRWYLDGAVTP